ncbi:hypothetical protein JXQ31_05375 [candidate division KSB1 bacterium]|nr:hypothetical protein [candidate division KSB1 bacterium]
MQTETLKNEILTPMGLHDLAENDIDNLLSIIVKKTDNKETYFFKDLTFNEYSHCFDLNKKFIYEINKWINFIINHEKLNINEQYYTVVFEKYFKNKNYFPLSRTLRMLLFLESIFINNFNDPENATTIENLNKNFNINWNIILTEKSDLFVYGKEFLIDDINLIKQTTIPVNHNFHISLALLFIIAVFYSQTEAYRTVFWETYSAERGRTEIQKRFQFLDCFTIEGTDHTVLDFIIDLVTIIIRYQSDPGQLVRFFGDFKYYKKIAWLTKEKYNNAVINEKILHSIFNILAIIEEARNHQLPVMTDHTKNHIQTGIDLGEVLNKGVHEPLDLNQLKNMLINLSKNKKYLQNYEKIKKDYELQREGFTFRWSFARSIIRKLPVVEPDFYRFLKLTEEYVIQNIRENNPDNIDIKNLEKLIAQFSFGRDQSHNLKKLIFNNIKKIMSHIDETDSQHHFADEFEKAFYYHILTIPDPFEQNNKEYVIKIKLKDYIAAPHLIFDEETANSFNRQCDSDSCVPKVLEEQKDENIDVCELFRYLYVRTKEEFDLQAKRLSNNYWMYFPVPLFKRILEVIYRLQPNNCISIPIKIKKGEDNNNQFPKQTDDDKTKTFLITFPRGLQKDNETDIEIIKCLANYVWSNVQNKAMSEGFKSADIILEELDKLSDTKNTKQDKNSNCIDKEYLIREIEAANRYNSYHILTEKYLTDYNKERENIKTIFQPEIQSLRPLSVTNLKKLLIKQLNIYSGNKDSENKSLIYIGIDIGGTFIKVQFFEFIKNAKEYEFKEIGDKFRLLTKQKRNTRSELPDKEISSQDFVKNIIQRINLQIFSNDEIRKKLENNNIHSIGITWPGPVRDNKVSGTSGILQQFSPLTREIPKNQIEDIWKLNIVDTFKNEWKDNFCLNKEISQKDITVPFVALVNDGDAEGMGAIAFPIFADPNFDLDANPDHEKENTLIVIKMGTGTAGAIFKNESLVKNLNEWGKIIIDLGAHPVFCESKKITPYPVGTANHYLSQKTLPRLATEFNENFKQIEQLDSLEIGLILNVGKIIKKEINNNTNKSRTLIRLIEQCGIREYIVSQKSEISEKVNVEVLQRILDEHKGSQDKKGDPELEEILQKYMHAYRSSAIEKLIDEIYIYGTIRLSKILRKNNDINNDHINQFLYKVLLLEKKSVSINNKNNEINPDFIYSKEFVIELLKYKPKIKEAEITDNYKLISGKLNAIHDECKKYAEIMGIYVGDFITLLYDQYNMDQLILSGGVLSDKTREIILSNAQKRLCQYGMNLLIKDGSVNEQQGEMKYKIELKHNDINNGRDFGCYGSAIYAANESVYQAQKDGLLALKYNLMKLEANATIEITEDELSFISEKTMNNIVFNNTLLNRKNTTDFIKNIGTDFNIILTKSDNDKEIFIKLS